MVYVYNDAIYFFSLTRLGSSPKKSKTLSVKEEKKEAPIQTMEEMLYELHQLLTETCMDMMARYTFSNCTTVPKRWDFVCFIQGSLRGVSTHATLPSHMEGSYCTYGFLLFFSVAALANNFLLRGIPFLQELISCLCLCYHVEKKGGNLPLTPFNHYTWRGVTVPRDCFFCGPPAMLEGPLSFQLSRCLYWCMYMYGCTDVGFSSTSKVNLRFSNENAMTDFHKTWYVVSGGAQVLILSVVTKCAYLIPHLHICSDWLITNKLNMQ